MKRFKALSFLFLLFFSVFSVLAGCTNEQDAMSAKPANEAKQANDKGDAASSTAASGEQAAIPEKLKKPVKIAAIMQMSIGTFSSQYIAGVKEQVQKFGGEVQIYNADNDLTKMASYVETAITQNVDAILLDHGRADALEGPVKKAVEKGIPVVAFDNDLNIPGVTVIDQDDYSLAWKTLKTLAEDLNGEGRIVTIWVGGFTPMERRHVIYEAFQKRRRTGDRRQTYRRTDRQIKAVDDERKRNADRHQGDDRDGTQNVAEVFIGEKPVLRQAKVGDHGQNGEQCSMFIQKFKNERRRFF